MARNARVVDQHVHAAELLHNLGEGPRHLVFLPHVRPNVQRPLPRWIQRIRHSLRQAGPIPGDDHGALGITDLRISLPKPLSRPCYDNHLIFQFIHSILLAT